jgi:hypothetical protein
VRRSCDRLEVAEDAFLGGLAVVGDGEEQAVGAGAFGGARKLDALWPVPAMTAPRLPTASFTARKSAAFSCSLRVGASPVVPAMTTPSLPLSRRATARRCAWP